MTMPFFATAQSYLAVTKLVLNLDISTILRTYRHDYMSRLQRGRFTEHLICMDGFSDYFSQINSDDREPYTDFESEPDLVVQIKQAMNALYHLEHVFLEIEKHKDSLSPINALPKLLDVLKEGAGDRVYKASQLIAHLDFGFLRTLHPEYHTILNVLETIKTYRSHYEYCAKVIFSEPDDAAKQAIIKSGDILFIKSNTGIEIGYRSMKGVYIQSKVIDKQIIELINNIIQEGAITNPANLEKITAFMTSLRISTFSNQIGRAVGHVLNNMQPDSKKIDYSVLTHFSAVLPGYIQDVTRFIKRYANEMKPQESALNRQTIQELEKNAIELLQSINVTQSNSLYSAFSAVHYVRIVRRLISLSTSTLNQIGNLNTATQVTICDNMLKIKKESVKLLVLADKLENIFLLRPGTLSIPVYAQIKEYYETLLFYIENTAVLGSASTLNDFSFIQLRVNEAVARNREANSRLFKATRVELAFKKFFSLLQPYRDRTLFSIDEPVKKQLIKCYLQMQPYVKAFSVVLDQDLTNDLLRPARYFEGFRQSTNVANLYAQKDVLMKGIQREIASQHSTILNNEMIIGHIKRNNDRELLLYPELLVPHNPKRVKLACEAFFKLLHQHDANTSLVCLDESIKKQLIEYYLLIQPYVKTCSALLDQAIMSNLVRPKRLFERYRHSLILSDVYAKESDVMKSIQYDVDTLASPESLTRSNPFTFRETDALNDHPLPQYDVNLVFSLKEVIESASKERTLTIRKIGHSFTYSFRPYPGEIQEGEITEDDLKPYIREENIKEEKLKALIDPAWCGLMKWPTDPTQCAFEEIAHELKGKDAIIMVNEKFFYADQIKQLVHEIEITEDNRSNCDLLRLRFTNAYTMADDFGLKLITSITGRIHPELTSDAFKAYVPAIVSVLSKRRHGDVIQEPTLFGAVFEVAKHIALDSSQLHHIHQYYVKKRTDLAEANDAFDEFVRLLTIAAGHNSLDVTLGTLSPEMKAQLKACYVKMQPWFISALSLVDGIDALDKTIINGLNTHYEVELLTKETNIVENTLYIKQTGYVFEYTVIDPFGRTKSGIISKEDLKQHQFETPPTPQQLHQALPHLLAVALNNGHVRPDPDQSQINIPDLIALGERFKQKIKLASIYANEEAVGKECHFERRAKEVYDVEMQARRAALQLPPGARAFHVIKTPYLSKLFKTMSASLHKDVSIYCNEAITKHLIRQSGDVPFPDIDYPETHNLDRLLGHSKQLANLKRLFNALYSLEQMFEELEALQDNSTRAVYVTQLVKAYLNVQTLWGLCYDLVHDPQLSFLCHTITSQYRQIQDYFGELFTPYSAPRPVDGPQTPGEEGIPSLWYTLHSFVLIPNDVRAQNNNRTLSPQQLTEIRARTKKLVIAIERVIERSDSYFRLFFEMPTIYCLFLKLKKQLAFFMTEIYTVGMDEQIGLLERLDQHYFAELLLAADRYEMMMGLKPGLLSGPLQDVLDEFYIGLLEPLDLRSDRYLACLTPDPIVKQDLARSNAYRSRMSRLQQRIEQANTQSVGATTQQIVNKKHYDKLTQLNEAIEAYQQINDNKWWLFYPTHKKQAALKPAGDRIQIAYEAAYPLLLAENKSRCCSIFMSDLPADVSTISLDGFDSAYVRVRNESKSINSLFYVNKMTGARTELGKCCSLFMSEIPVTDVSKISFGDFASGYIRVKNKNPKLNGLFYINKITGLYIDLNIDDDNLIKFDAKITSTSVASVLSTEELTFLAAFTQELRCCSISMTEMPSDDCSTLSLGGFVSGYIRVTNKKTGLNSLVYVNKITNARIDLQLDDGTLKKYDSIIASTQTPTVLSAENLRFVRSLPNHPPLSCVHDNLNEYDLKIMHSVTHGALSAKKLSDITRLTGHVHDTRHDRAHDDNVYPHVSQLTFPLDSKIVDNLKNTRNYYRRLMDGYKLEIAAIYNRTCYLQQLDQSQTILHKKIQQDYIESSFNRILTRIVTQCLEVPELKQEYSQEFEAYLSSVKRPIVEGCLAKIIFSQPSDDDKNAVRALKEILIIHCGDNNYQVGFCNLKGEYEQQLITDLRLIQSLSAYKSSHYIESLKVKDDLNKTLDSLNSSILCKPVQLSNDIQQTMQKALLARQAQFEEKSLALYRQLNEILTATGQFRAYATVQSQKISPVGALHNGRDKVNESLFEDKNTLAKKLKWIDTLEMIAKNSSLSPGQRLRNLHDEIQKLSPAPLFKTFEAEMLAYRRFDSVCFAWLQQCFLSLLTALNLYTPEPVKCYQQITKTISGSLRFFKPEQVLAVESGDIQPVMTIV